LQGAGTHITVSEQHPQKQGLKRKVVEDAIKAKQAVSEQHPQKQGLKLPDGLDHPGLNVRLRATSTKTRIETLNRGHCRPPV